MPKLRAALRKRLKNAKRIAFLGIGSELRSDDAAGVFVARKLKEFFKHKKNVRIFLGGTSPENLTKEIRDYSPTHTIIIDSTDLKKEPGAFCVIEPKDIGGISFSTHRIPLSIFSEYLNNSIGCETIIIGIQPKSIEFNKVLSKEVLESIKKVSDVIKEVISAVVI